MAPSGNVAPRTQVAILGGGASAMAAAFWLSSPAVRDRFQVTVYTQGWRLGGKCATGRNAARHERIEEHGLHILMGCYENAFRTLRACYDEWQPAADCPLKPWTSAFVPRRDVVLMEPDGPGDPPAWQPWPFTFPQRSGTPGDGDALWLELLDALSGQTRDTILLLKLLHWLKDSLSANLPGEIVTGIEEACAACVAVLLGSRHDAAPAVGEQLKQLNHRIGGAVAAEDGAATERTLWRWWHIANLGLATVAGLLADWVLYGEHAFDRRNEQDLRDWLRDHGATEAALASAPIRALYELTFAFPGGDASGIDKGRIAAGVALRFMLEAVLGFKGAPLWEMRAGMGETVFTPFHQVLTARGVRIALFHRVTDVQVDASGQVGRIVLARQADFIDGIYQPFVRVKGLDCWPNEPDWTQLRNGDALRQAGVDFESCDDLTHVDEPVLIRGADFDKVVLAIPPEAIKRAAPGLARHAVAWADMLTHSAAVATQAMQLWMQPPAEELGWQHGRSVLGAYREPYDSAANMTHLLEREAWPEPAPRMLAYFCGCLCTTPTPPADPQAAARSQADAWVRRSIGALWPDAVQPDGSLHPGITTSAYYRANVDPSELYVQTLPGSVRYRLSSGTALFGNLHVAGDWTLTRFSGGCFESAIESGMRAAAAICGEPEHIVGA